MKKIIITISLSIYFAVNVLGWTNPLTLNNEWSLYGIGDPYILKYRGIYYLYCSTKNNNIGVKCWSTKDFINWSDAITCSTDPITKTAYAPEVVYSNGTFYMYTSPAGGGHYVLTSTSPAGPFVPVTGNLGKSIDGSVFINDDGNWYFYHANGNGIMGCAMTNPTTIGTSVNLNARMGNNWTEGPCMFKRNGIYYLMYTGNHVISKGYRTDYARSSGGPLSSFTPQAAQNPILISAEGTHVGLGHGSAFIGPDLDTYYFTYHNLAGDYGVGPYRRLNFDRMAWNGDKMLMLGPTSWEQQAMQLPDMSDYFERTTVGSEWTLSGGGNWSIVNMDYLKQEVMDDAAGNIHKAVYSQPTADNFTAEFTVREELRANENARYGVVFGYKDEQNYGIAVLRSATNQLEVNFLKENVWTTPVYATLPASFNHSAWHNIRIEKSGINYKFFVDGILKATATNHLTGGKIGYLSGWNKANFGYIAFSNKVNGSGIFDTYKPIPGNIEAVHYIAGGEGVGYADMTQNNSGGKYIRNDKVDIRDCTEGGHAITDNQTGEWYKYNVNIKSTGTYNLGFRYSATSDAGKVRIWQGDTDVSGLANLPSTAGMNNWRTFTIRGLQLTKGYQTIRVEIVAGGFDFYKMQFEEADNSVVTITDTFNSTFSSNWNYNDGTWAVLDGKAVVNGYGKRTLGNIAWSDYTLQTDIVYTNTMNGGLIFRVNNPALGGAGKDPALGTDFYQGYFVTLNATSVVLGKQNYNWTSLKSASGNYSLNTKYTIKVVASGANIKVYVDDMDTPKIDYTDPDPFIDGKVGLRSFNAYIQFDNFTVSTTDNSNPSGTKDVGFSDSVHLYPNPAKDKLTLTNVGDFSDLTVYKMDGQQVYYAELNSSEWSFDVDGFRKGLYLLQLRNGSGDMATCKFLKN
ncbi:MAG: family 43 glycosylhydrolase [Paludibacter sp.]|nr:family 43 glycosylhydrolase [Paludibacter sp.]